MAAKKTAAPAVSTVEDYLDALPPERRAVVSAVRKHVRKHLPKGYREGIAFGAIGYVVPLEVFPDTYNGQPLTYVALAAKKNYFTLHLMRVYGDPEAERQLRAAFAKAGKKIDLGKACLRFKSLDDLNLDAIGALIASTTPEAWIRIYEASRTKTART